MSSFFGAKGASNSVRDDNDESMIWMSSSTDASSLSRSLGFNSKKKADFIPSGFIQQQIALEEEARRRAAGDGLAEQDNVSPNGSSNRPNLTAWVTPDQVLTQKFSSGQLGYDVPRKGSDYETLRRAELEAATGSATGATVNFAPETSAGPETEKSPRLYPDLRTSVASLNKKAASTDSIPGSPLTTIKPALHMDDATAEEKRRRRSSVRFTDVDGARSAAANTDNNKDSIDILTRATTPLGHETLNCSLGPALGAVGGRQSSSTSWSQLSNADKLNAGAGVGVKQGARSSENRSNAIFPERDDLLARQQEVALAEQANKEWQSRNKKGDDEDDNKDAPHYLPGYLLDSFSGAKAAKVEPFVDEKTDLEWTNTETQSSIRPPLMNEDAPPAETLDSLARKEGLYTRPIATYSNSFFQDTRMDDIQMNEAPATAPAPAPLPQSIIVYGFEPELSSYMLNQFRSFGAVQFYKTGYSVLKGSSVNWMKIRYQEPSGVRRACGNHLKTVGGYRVGVSLCPSFDTFVEASGGPITMSMAGKVDDNNKDSQECTEEERQSVEAGLSALNAIQRNESAAAGQDQGFLNSSQLRPATTIHHPRPLDTSRSPWASQQSHFEQSIQHHHSMQASTLFRQDEEEDLRSILGHSITSGGSLLGSRRPASADGFLRSTTSAHTYPSRHHSDMSGSQEHQFKSSQAAGDHSFFGGASRALSPADSGVSLRMQTESPVGFAPLFGPSSSSSSRPPASGGAPIGISPDQPSSSSIFGQPRPFSTEPLMRRTSNQSTLGSSPLRASVLARSNSLGAGAGVVRPGEDLQDMHIQKRARLSRTMLATTTNFSSSSSSSQTSPPAPSSSIYGGSYSTNNAVRSPSFRTPQERSKFLADGDAEVRRHEQLQQQQQQNGGNGGGGMWGSIVEMAKRNLFWG